MYDALGEQARAVLRSGHAVIADAAFLQQGQRAAIEAIAATAGVSFGGLWLEAPPGVLATRVQVRSGDASDADESVVLRQLRLDLGLVKWPGLNASGSAQEVLADATRHLSLA